MPVIWWTRGTRGPADTSVIPWSGGAGAAVAAAVDRPLILFRWNSGRTARVFHGPVFSWCQPPVIAPEPTPLVIPGGGPGIFLHGKPKRRHVRKSRFVLSPLVLELVPGQLDRHEAVRTLVGSLGLDELKAGLQPLALDRAEEAFMLLGLLEHGIMPEVVDVEAELDAMITDILERLSDGNR